MEALLEMDEPLATAILSRLSPLDDGSDSAMASAFILGLAGVKR